MKKPFSCEASRALYKDYYTKQSGETYPYYMEHEQDTI